VESLRHIRPRPATTPFFSTVTGTALVGSEVDGAHWYRNTRQPVLFTNALNAMISEGFDTSARTVNRKQRIFQ